MNKVFAPIFFVLIFISGCQNNAPAPKNEQKIENSTPKIAEKPALEQPRLPKLADSVPQISEKMPQIDPSDTTKKYIYFTIDDGPSNYSTKILEIAEAEGVGITVFLVGSNCFSKQRAAMVDAYHQSKLVEVGNHSFSHANEKYDSWYSNPEGVFADFMKNQDQLSIKTNLVRMPGRPIWDLGKRGKHNSMSGGSSAKKLADKGYEIYGWDLEWHFSHRNGAPKESADVMFSRIKACRKNGETFVKNHVVLLLHERHYQREDEMRRLIRLLKEDNWQFSYLQNYPA